MSQDFDDNRIGGAKPAKAMDLRAVALKQMPPLAIIVGLAVLMRHEVADLDVSHIRTALGTVGPAQWLLGLGFTALSFWALGRYDVVVHRLVGRNTDPKLAAQTGMAAIAVGQTIGMGALTGALVRWRLVPGLGLPDATRIAVIVTISFFSAWAVVSAATVLLFDVALPFATLAALGILFFALAFVVASLMRPGPLVRVPIPSLKAMGLIVLFTTIDTLAAAAALHAMLPPELTIGFGPLFAAYLLSLGAGLILTTPGGVGPFEVAMIALLPNLPQEPLLAAILAFRAVYYALPAVLGGVALIRGGAAPLTNKPTAKLTPVDARRLPLMIEAALDTAPRAEAALLRHGRFQLLRNARGRATALAATSSQSVIMLGDPLARTVDPREILSNIQEVAQTNMRAPVLYKCGARLACAARRAGWQVTPIAKESWLDPRSYTRNGAKRRSLRRKLRKAESAGLAIEVIDAETPSPLPVHEMTALATAWAAARGGERGFSMGVWDPETLHHALVVLARNAAGELKGFATFHTNQTEVTLDLMRQSDSAPDGMMYLVVDRAIEWAAARGTRRFSLAAVPLGRRGDDARLTGHLRHHLDRASGAEGLRQFKSAFDPKWETLYMAAPTRGGLILGAVNVAWEILRKSP